MRLGSQPLLRCLTLLLGLYCAASLTVRSAPDRSDAAAFFNEAADTFLREHYSFGVRSIPVAPTNLYTAGVHRLLQLAANLYDAGQTDPLPTVFRPVLRTLSDSSVIVDGYVQDNSATNITSLTNSHEIPIVIGAKKGLPNFNEVRLLTVAQVARKLELVRLATNLPPRFTNQMYLLSISNNIMVEAWNSYTSNYPRPLTLTLDLAGSGSLRSPGGELASLAYTNHTELLVTNWPGKGFQIPVNHYVMSVPHSAYNQHDDVLRPVGSRFDSQAAIGFPVPQWTYSVRHRLRYSLRDGDRLIDYVQFSGLSQNLDLSAALFSSFLYNEEPPSIAGTWLTNRLGGGPAPATPTRGIQNQIELSAGYQYISDSDWVSYSYASPTGPDRVAALNQFRQFLSGSTNVPGTNIVAPFTPLRRLIYETVWEANDPLVHYHFSDLVRLPTNSIRIPVLPPKVPLPTNSILASPGMLNYSYSPWGGNPWRSSYNDPWAFDSRIKDPSVFSSDNWNFPQGPDLKFEELGRVHRGTPWQTIYLKAGGASNDVSLRPFFDHNTHPTNDWRISELVRDWVDTNRSLARVSINETNPVRWATALSGLKVRDGRDDPSGSGAKSEVTLTADDPGIPLLVAAINRERQRQPGQYFRHVTDLLQVPELSVASPWLAQDWLSQEFGNRREEAMEALPSQLFERLRSDPVGRLQMEAGVTRLTYDVPVDGRYQLEKSDDLMNWFPVLRRDSAGRRLDFNPPSPTPGENLFYRLRSFE